MKEIVIFYDDKNSIFTSTLEDTLNLFNFATRIIYVKDCIEAESIYKKLVFQNQKPDCLILDIQCAISFSNKIEEEWGNNIVTGVVLDREKDIEKAERSSAYFCIVKNTSTLSSLKNISKDIKILKNTKKNFKTYK